MIQKECMTVLNCKSCHKYDNCPMEKDRTIKFTIPLQSTTKKNNQQILINKNTGKRFISQSERYKQFENDCKWFMPKIRTIDYPVNIKYTFYRKTANRCDLSNLISALDDILVKYGVIVDDNYKIVVGHDFSRVKIDSRNPRIEVEISEV